MTLSIHNIAGIEDASTDEIKLLGNEAFKVYVKLFKTPITSQMDFDRKLRWYQDIGGKCIRILKERGIYTEDQAGEIYRKFMRFEHLK